MLISIKSTHNENISECSVNIVAFPTLTQPKPGPLIPESDSDLS